MTEKSKTFALAEVRTLVSTNEKSVVVYITDKSTRKLLIDFFGNFDKEKNKKIKVVSSNYPVGGENQVELIGISALTDEIGFATIRFLLENGWEPFSTSSVRTTVDDVPPFTRVHCYALRKLI